jgi:alkylation response protein AidB-like acyl-CoA dehydrogenase
VPAANLVGRVGFGISHVAAAALEQGRYSVSWGSVGIGQACLDACRSYAAERRQFGVALADHQLIRALLAEMIVNVRAARLLCLRAGYLRDTRDPGAPAETMAAKYFASTMATRAANDAVQIHGANGLSEDFPVARYLRDSKVMEVIEGSTQIQQITLPLFDFQEF